MKKYFFALAALFFISFLSNAQTTTPTEVKVIAVVFHADWCPYCAKLSEKVDGVKAEVDLSEVEFVKFDFTDKETKKATETFAKEKQVSSVLENNKGTGFLVLVDVNTKEELVRISAKDSPEKIKSSFEKYLN